MESQETSLEMSQRHVAEGTARVLHQTALVTELAEHGHDTAEAGALLVLLEESPQLMYEKLAREQGLATHRHGMAQKL